MKKILLSILVMGTFLFSQSFTDIIPFNKTIGEIQYQHTSFKDSYWYSSDQKIYSGVYNFKLTLPISNNFRLKTSIPFMLADMKTYKNSSSFGNLDFQLDYKKNSDTPEGFTFSSGITIPLSDENNYPPRLIGYSADLFNSKNFHSNTLALHGTVAYLLKPSPISFVELRVGPEVLIPTKYVDSRKTEYYLNYSVAGGININELMLFSSIRGRMLASEKFINEMDRFNHSFSIGAGYKFGRIIPKLDYSIYLGKNIRNSINGVFSIGVNVLF